MIQFPNCKINLGLNIISRRPDGFHNLETVFYPVSLHEAFEIMPAPDHVFDFQSSGLDIPGDPGQNLCVRAYRLLKADFGLPEVKMHLHKVIPMGSGLGGGSSDGACTLKLLNELFTLSLTGEKLREYARRLGSDCAFFIDNQPCFASEKGDQMEPCGIDLSGYFLAIIIPRVHVSTAEAYGKVVPAKPLRGLKELILLPLEEWKGLIVNDFELSVFEKHPEIESIKLKLYSSGAVYSSLSGSGSAVYGIFVSLPDLSGFEDCSCRVIKL
jgi:4-diphosphocytidyl-2-C-methyl-D-erythritol kinase